MKSFFTKDEIASSGLLSDFNYNDISLFGEDNSSKPQQEPQAGSLLFKPTQFDLSIDNPRIVHEALNTNVIDGDTLKNGYVNNVPIYDEYGNNKIRISSVDSTELPDKHNLLSGSPEQDAGLMAKSQAVDWLFSRSNSKVNSLMLNTAGKKGVYSRLLGDIYDPNTKTSLAGDQLTSGNAIVYNAKTKEQKQLSEMVLDIAYNNAVQSGNDADWARYNALKEKADPETQTSQRIKYNFLNKTERAVMGATGFMFGMISDYANNLKKQRIEQNGNEYKNDFIDKSLGAISSASGSIRKGAKKANKKIDPNVAMAVNGSVSKAYNDFKHGKYISATKNILNSSLTSIDNSEVMSQMIFGFMALPSVANQQYNELVKQGVPKDRAVLAGAIYSSLNYLEANSITGSLGGGIKSMLLKLGINVGTEPLANSLQDVVTQLAINPDTSINKLKHIAKVSARESLGASIASSVSVLAKSAKSKYDKIKYQKMLNSLINEFNIQEPTQEFNTGSNEQNVQENVDTQQQEPVSEQSLEEFINKGTELFHKVSENSSSKNIDDLRHHIDSSSDSVLKEVSNTLNKKKASGEALSTEEERLNNVVNKELDSRRKTKSSVNAAKVKLSKYIDSEGNRPDDEKKTNLQSIIYPLSIKVAHKIFSFISNKKNNLAYGDAINLIQEDGFFDDKVNHDKWKEVHSKNYEKMYTNGHYSIAKLKEGGWSAYNVSTGEKSNNTDYIISQQINKEAENSKDQKTNVYNLGTINNALHKALFGSQSEVQELAEIAEEFKANATIKNKKAKQEAYRKTREKLFNYFDVKLKINREGNYELSEINNIPDGINKKDLEEYIKHNISFIGYNESVNPKFLQSNKEVSVSQENQQTGSTEDNLSSIDGINIDKTETTLIYKGVKYVLFSKSKNGKEFIFMPKDKTNNKKLKISFSNYNGVPVATYSYEIIKIEDKGKKTNEIVKNRLDENNKNKLINKVKSYFSNLVNSKKTKAIAGSQVGKLMSFIKNNNKLHIAEYNNGIIIGIKDVNGNYHSVQIVKNKNNEYTYSNSYTYSDPKNQTGEKSTYAFIDNKGDKIAVFESTKDYIAVMSQNKNSLIGHNILITNGSSIDIASKISKVLKNKDVKIFVQNDSANMKFIHELQRVSNMKKLAIVSPKKGYTKFHHMLGKEDISLRGLTSNIYYQQKAENQEWTKQQTFDNLGKIDFKLNEILDNKTKDPTIDIREEVVLIIKDLMKLGLSSPHAKFIGKLIEIRYKNIIEESGIFETIDGVKYELNKSEYTTLDKKAKEAFDAKLLDDFKKITDSIVKIKQTIDSGSMSYNPETNSILLKAIALTKKLGLNSKDNFDNAHTYLFVNTLHELSHSFMGTMTPSERSLVLNVFKKLPMNEWKDDRINDNVKNEEAFAMLFTNWILNSEKAKKEMERNIGTTRFQKMKDIFNRFYDFLSKSLINLTVYLGIKEPNTDKGLAKDIENFTELNLLFGSLLGNQEDLLSLTKIMMNGEEATNAKTLSNIVKGLSSYGKKDDVKFEQADMFKKHTIGIDVELSPYSKKLNKYLNDRALKYHFVFKSFVYNKILQNTYQKILDSKYKKLVTLPKEFYKTIANSDIVQEIKIDWKLYDKKTRNVFNDIYNISNNMLDKNPSLARETTLNYMRNILTDVDDKTKTNLTRILLHTGLYTIGDKVEFLETIKNMSDDKLLQNKINDSLKELKNNDFTKKQIKQLDNLAYFQVFREPPEGVKAEDMQPVSITLLGSFLDQELAHKYVILKSISLTNKEHRASVKTFFDSSDKLDKFIPFVVGLGKEYKQSLEDNNVATFVSGFVQEPTHTAKDIIVVSDKIKAKELKYKNNLFDWRLVSEVENTNGYKAIFIRTKLDNEFASGLTMGEISQINGDYSKKQNKYDYNSIPVYDNIGNVVGYKKVIPMVIAREYLGIDENLDSVLSGLSYQIEVNNASKIVNNYILNSNSEDIDNEESIKKNNPFFINTYENTLDYDEELNINDFKALDDEFFNKYKRVERSMLPNGFETVGFVRKDIYNKIFGYKKMLLFGGSQNRTMRYADKVWRDFISVFKKNILKYPPVLMNNLISGITIMVSTVGIKHSTKDIINIVNDIPRITKGINELKKNLKNMYIYKISGEEDKYNAIKNKIENSESYYFYSKGFIQSLTDEIINETMNDNNILEYYGEKTIRSSIKFAFNLISKKTMDENKFENKFMNNLKTIYLSSDTQAGSSLNNIMKYTDYVLRIATYNSLRRKGMNKNMATDRAIDGFVDYRGNLPMMIQFLSSYGIVPFAGWITRMQPAMYRMLKENPTVTVPLFISGLLATNDYTGMVRTSSYNVFNDFIFGIPNSFQNPIDLSIVPPHLKAMYSGTIGGSPLNLFRLLGFTIK